MPTIELLTVQDVADLFQVSRRKIHNLVHDHGLPHVRVGRAFRFRRVDVDRWLAEHTESVPRPGPSRAVTNLTSYDWSKS